MIDPEQEHHRQFIKEVITGLAAVEARRVQRERNQTRPDTRKQPAT